MQINIAVVQCAIQPFAPAENLAKAEQFIKEASSKADLIVFPEDFVTGSLYGDKTFADYEGRYARCFQNLAVKYKIDIVPGSFIEGEQDRLYNTSYYIDKTGIIRGRYRKVNLWHPERAYIKRGNRSCVFDTQYGRVGIIICWDLMFSNLFQTMLRKGVEIVICPSYWCFEDATVGLGYDPNSEINLINALCTARAFENGIILVYANAAGEINTPDGIEHFTGYSQITVPFTGPLRILSHSNEEMFIQSVDTTLLKDAERAYLIRRDLFLSNPLNRVAAGVRRRLSTGKQRVLHSFRGRELPS
jgi:predicted amidohydrolase